MSREWNDVEVLDLWSPAANHTTSIAHTQIRVQLWVGTVTFGRLQTNHCHLLTTATVTAIINNIIIIIISISITTNITNCLWPHHHHRHHHHHQSHEWSVSTIFGGWLSAYLYCRPTTTTIVQHRHVWGSKNSHKSGWSLIHCCWTASVEQPTSPSMWLWTYLPGVPPVSEDTLVLLRTAAPSDCFCAPYKYAFTLHYITLPPPPPPSSSFTSLLSSSASSFQCMKPFGGKQKSCSSSLVVEYWISNRFHAHPVHSCQQCYGRMCPDPNYLNSASSEEHHY